MTDPTPAQDRTETARGADPAPVDVGTAEGARETLVARIAEVIEATWWTGGFDYRERTASALADLVDAEVAAAVSEAQAEVERLEGNLSALLCDLTGGRLSKTNYDVRTMVQAVEQNFQDDVDEAEARAESAEAEVERLREGIRALADARDVKYPERFQFAAGDNHVAGYRQAQDDLRALLTPSPAATTGGDNNRCRVTPGESVGGPHAYAAAATDAPAPVSSGDAGTGEAMRRLRSCVEAWPDCYEGGYDPSCCRFPKSCSCDVYDPERVADEDLEP